jgi:hypothetical protein
MKERQEYEKYQPATGDASRPYLPSPISRVLIHDTIQHLSVGGPSIRFTLEKPRLVGAPYIRSQDISHLLPRLPESLYSLFIRLPEGDSLLRDGCPLLVMEVSPPL